MMHVVKGSGGVKSARSSFALRLTLFYVIISGLWIFLSDKILAVLIKDPLLLNRWQTYKGWLFVLMTGFVFYMITYKAFKIRSQNERNLLLANEKLRALIAASPLAILTLDTDNRILSWNAAAEKMFGWTEKEVLGCFNPIVPDQKQLEYRSYLKTAISGDVSKVIETDLQKKDGVQISVGLSLAPIRNIKGETTALVALISDMSEQKVREEQLKYLSLNDALTGIYNRAYFEHEMHRLENSRYTSIGMIVCDLDGLKLYNDSMGHAVGDKLLKAAAQVIKSCFREGDVVARIGGDEFAVLLPEADLVAVESACERIRQALQDYNKKHSDHYLSVSVGYAVSAAEKISMLELFKEADNNMYREKLRRSETVRDTTMQILMRALSVRDYVSEGHTERLETMAADLAGKSGIASVDLDDLRMFARFHDIGKVGIPESILFKSEPLTAKERELIRRHPEIGHRIALSAPDLVHLADWILKHHEWWNGSGYPLGLRGRDIPLECRILAIVDAFDALTNDRPYRKAKSTKAALEELKRFAGQQFDPELVDIFVGLVVQGEYHKLPQNA